MSTSKKTSKAKSAASVAIADHLAELRVRLAWVGLAFIVFSSLAYNFRELLVSVVLSPLGDEKLIYLTPAGGFSFIFQITMYAGMLATAPLVVYHLYRFISPAFSQHHQRYGLRVVFASTALMVLGVSFGYFVAIPAALSFLTHFASDFVQPNLTADSYLGFVVAYVLGLGLLFQLPLLLLLVNWIRPFNKGDLLKTQQYVFVGSFIAAAMITPTPDALNQAMVAVPIIVIYQTGVIAVAIINRSRRKQSSAAKSWQTQVEQPASPLQRAMHAEISQPAYPVMQNAYEVVEPKEPVSIPVVQPIRSMDGMRLSPPKRQVQRRVVRAEVPPPRPIRQVQRYSGQGLGSLSIDGIKNY